MSQSTSTTAGNKKTGFTLDELARTIHKALAADMPATSTIRAQVGFHGQIQQLTITTQEK